MKEIRLQPKQRVFGEVVIPPSKSYAQRAIVLGALAQNNVVLQNIGKNDDVIAVLNAVRDLGAGFFQEDDLIIYRSIDLSPHNSVEINIGESGLAARIFSAVSLLFEQDFILNGEGSILNRTMEMVIEGVKQYGKKVESEQQKLPLKITGKIKEEKYFIEIDGSVSSQFISGLILVAPFLKFDSEIVVRRLKSKSYLQITFDVLHRFGLSYNIENFEKFQIPGNQEIHRPVDYRIEGDWSAAAFLAVAAAIGGKITLQGLKKFSKQGDRVIIDVVKQAGAMVSWEREMVTIEKKSILPFQFDATDCPDLFPCLAVLAAYADGISRIKGVHRLVHKESNRALALKEEFLKIGIEITLENDEMIICGKKEKVEKEITFFSHNDHRIAMALSLFSIGAKKPIVITHFNAVNKSYPDFFETWEKISGKPMT